MEKFPLSKKEKEEDLKKIKRSVAIGAGIAAATMSYGKFNNSDVNGFDKDTTKIDSDTESVVEHKVVQDQGVYDPEENTFTYKKENIPKVAEVEKEIFEEEVQEVAEKSYEDMTDSEKLKYDIESNNPDRFFKYEKYEKYSDEAKEFASWITDTYNKLNEDKNFSPKDVFTNEYYMAIALTESGGDGKAESHAGAVGAMQLKPVAVRDLSRVLGVLKRWGANIESYNKGDVLDGNELAREVLNMSKEDYPLNISMGKAYLNGVYATYPDFKEDRDLLTTAYNFGAPRVKKVMAGQMEYNHEAKGYAPKVNLYEKNIITIKKLHPDLNNMEVRDIARDYGHQNGEITEEFITYKLGSKSQIASL